MHGDGEKEKEMGKTVLSPSIPSKCQNTHTHTHTHVYMFKNEHTITFIPKKSILSFSLRTHLFTHARMHTHTHIFAQFM